MTSIPTQSIHTIEDVGNILLSTQSDLHTIRLYLNKLQEQPHTSTTDVIAALQNVINNTENKLCEKVELIQISVANNTLNALPTYDAHTIQSLIPYNSTLNLTATQRTSNDTAVRNKYGGKIHKKSNKFIDTIVAPDNQQQRILANVNSRSNTVSTHRHTTPLIRTAQQQLQPQQQKPLLLTNTRYGNIDKTQKYNIDSKLKSQTLSFVHVKQFDNNRHTRYDHYESKTNECENTQLLLLPADSSRPDTVNMIENVTNTTPLLQCVPSEYDAALIGPSINNNTLHEPTIRQERTYDTLIDTYSLHQLQIRNYRYIEQTNDYISFKRVHTDIWSLVIVVLNNLITVCYKLQMKLANIDGHTVIELVHRHKASLQNMCATLRDTELLYCIQDIDYNTHTTQLQQKRYIVTPNITVDHVQHNAAIHIQAIYRMYRQRIVYKLRAYHLASVIKLQQWFRYIIARQRTHTAYTQLSNDRHTQWVDTVQNKYIQQYNTFQQRYKTYVYVALSDIHHTDDIHRSHDLLILCELLSDSKVDILYISQYKLPNDVIQHYYTILQKYCDTQPSVKAQSSAKHRIKFLAIDDRTTDILFTLNATLPSIYTLLYASTHTIKAIKQYTSQRNCVLINNMQHTMLQQLAIQYNTPLMCDYAGDVNAACESLLQIALITCDTPIVAIALLIQPNNAYKILSVRDIQSDNLMITYTLQQQYNTQIQSLCQTVNKQLHGAGYTGYVTLKCYVANDCICVHEIHTSYSACMSAHQLSHVQTPQNNTMHYIYIPVLQHPNISLLQYNNFMAVLQINSVTFDYTTCTGTHILLSDTLSCGHIGLYISHNTIQQCVQQCIQTLQFLQQYFTSVHTYKLTADPSIYSISTCIKQLKQYMKTLK